MTTPEIQRIESDVFDPAGDRAYVLGRNLTGTTEVRVGTALATGVVVWGDAPRHNGLNTRLSSALAVSNYFGASTGGFAVFINPGALGADASYASNGASPKIFSDSGGYVTCKITSLGATIYIFDGAQKLSNTIPLASNEPVLLFGKWDGTNVYLTKAGQAFPAGIACTGPQVLTGTLNVGTNYNNSAFADMVTLELMLMNTVPTQAALDNITAFVNQKYGTTFGGIQASSFNPATLSLTGWWSAGNYVSGTYTGSASAGTSGGRNLTEATVPPAVASGVGMKLTVPANAAGKYPLTVKNASGRTTLPNAVEYANPKTIPNCVWWLRPDAAVITQAAGVVTAWADQSGVGDANRNVAPAGTDKAAYNASDATYNGKPTVGTFTVATDTRLVNPAAWTATYATFTMGAIGHTPGTSNNYFTFEQNADYNALLGNNSGCGAACGGTGTGATLLSTPGAGIAEPRAFLSAVFNGTASSLYLNDNVPVTGTLGTHTLGNAAMSLGSYPAASATNAVSRIAEVYAHSRALTSREQRTIRRYRDSYYGKAA
jgi:hypothetical protein